MSLNNETTDSNEPIILRAVLTGHKHESMKVEAKVGEFPYFTGFYGLHIERIENQCITFSFDKNIKLRYSDVPQLRPGETIHFYSEIDGPEDSHGCVYESYDYYLAITWK